MPAKRYPASGQRTWRLLLTVCLTLLASAAIAAQSLAADATSSRPTATAAQAQPTATAAQADHIYAAYTAEVKRLKRCLSQQPKHPDKCSADRRAVQRAGIRLTATEHRLATAARSTARGHRFHTVASGSSHSKETSTTSPVSTETVSNPPAGSTPPVATTPPTSTSPVTTTPAETVISPITPTTPAETVSPITPTPPPPTTTTPSVVIIGTNDALGWGNEDAQKTLTAGLTSARVEAGAGLNTPQHAREEGFTNNLVIVGDTPYAERLATVNTAAWTTKALTEVKEAVANGDTLLEVGNEMYLKGSSPLGATNGAEPAKYAEMYMSLANAVDAAGIKGVKLLFNSFGNYVPPNGTASRVANDGGWLADALAAQPGLKQRVDGFTSHPYGLAGENGEDDWGPGALQAEHNQAAALGFANTDYYVSEFGVRTEASGPTGSASLAQQAERVQTVYAELIGLGYVKGIWFYESHDESSSDKWGFVSGSWTPRPVLGVLERFAREQNQ